MIHVQYIDLSHLKNPILILFLSGISLWTSHTSLNTAHPSTSSGDTEVLEVNLQQTEMDIREREELSNDYAQDSAVRSPQWKNKQRYRWWRKELFQETLYTSRSNEWDSGIHSSVSVLFFLLCFWVLTPLSSDHLRKLFLSLRFGD